MSSLYTIPRVRSCKGCSTAKTKCEPDFNSTKCKRCTKQNIDCVLKEPASRKRRKQTDSPTAESSESSSPLVSNSPTINQANIHVQVVEVRQGIEYYRRSLFQWFPFIMPPDLCQPVVQFIKEKPFMSLVIAMLGCTQDRSRQRELAVQSRNWLATHVVQKGEKSLDILQGLLLATHWYTFQSDLSTLKNVFLHLAMSMIIDLGLFKSPHARCRLMTQEEAASTSQPNLDSAPEHTLEEKRALLGCIYLASAITTASLSVEAASHFSVYAEQCYEELEKSSLVSDQILAHLCHFQHMVEQFSAERSVLVKMQRRRNSAMRNSTPTIGDRYPGADGLGYVAYWDNLLTERWKHIPDNAKTKVLLSEYCYAKVCLHDSCLEPLLLSTPSARLKIVHSCISSLKSLNDAIIPLYEEPHALLDIPLHSYARANHSMFVALQLCSLKCGDLSAEYVENELKLTGMFGSVADKVASLLEGIHVGSVPAFHRRLIPMAKAIQQGIAARLGTARTNETFELGMCDVEAVPDLESFVDVEFLQQFVNADDNMWLHTLMAADEYQSAPVLLH